jgi:hypothetical protein
LHGQAKPIVLLSLAEGIVFSYLQLFFFSIFPSYFPPAKTMTHAPTIFFLKKITIFCNTTLASVEEPHEPTKYLLRYLSSLIHLLASQTGKHSVTSRLHEAGPAYIWQLF